MADSKHDNKSPPTEAFPAFEDTVSDIDPLTGGESPKGPRERASSNTPTIANRLRNVTERFQESSLPLGAWDAAGQIASSVPSVTDIQRGSFGSEGWSAEGQLHERSRRVSLTRNSNEDGEVPHSRRRSSQGSSGANAGSATYRKTPRLPTVESYQLDTIPSMAQEQADGGRSDLEKQTPMKEPVTAGSSSSRISDDTGLSPQPTTSKHGVESQTSPFSNGYEFPPKYTWQQSTVIGLKAFWKFTCTPFGFVVVVYGLNVVGWGAMIFFLLLNAAPAMCTPDCNDINSPRRIWIEIDAQVLTALFCVTGLGLIPWRFRDLYYLLKYRLQKDELSLRRLGGIHGGWLRLPGSQRLPVDFGPQSDESQYVGTDAKSVAFPLKTIPNAPLTGTRAPDTALWKLDAVIWLYVWNTFLQCVLNGIMWGLDRYTRPSWATGLFVALACIVAGVAGIMTFIEGKKVKSIEGVPVSPEELEKLRLDREAGIVHWNNMSGKPPKEKKITS